MLCNGSLESLQSALECIVLSVSYALCNVSEVITAMYTVYIYNVQVEQ